MNSHDFFLGSHQNLYYFEDKVDDYQFNDFHLRAEHVQKQPRHLRSLAA